MSHKLHHMCMKNRLNQYLGAFDALGLWVGLLSLRLILGWDFFESGLEKFNGDN